jgi:FkbM family methyltransferase
MGKLRNVSKTVARKARTLSEIVKDSKGRFASAKERRRYFVFSVKERLGRNLGLKPKSYFIDAKLAQKIRDRPIRVFFRKNAWDFALLDEIFFRQIYKLRQGEKINSILDLGANIGLSALFFASRYPNARIECVEPVGENAAALRLNLISNRVNAKVHECAVGNTSGLMEIFLNEQASAHSAHQKTGSVVQVEQRTLDAIAGGRKFDLIKFDIEGSEFEMIKGGRKTLLNANCIAGEIHFEHLGEKKARQVKEWLERHFDVEYRGSSPNIPFVAYRKKSPE